MLIPIEVEEVKKAKVLDLRIGTIELEIPVKFELKRPIARVLSVE
jgi:hypothetical protein